MARARVWRVLTFPTISGRGNNDARFPATGIWVVSRIHEEEPKKNRYVARPWSVGLTSIRRDRVMTSTQPDRMASLAAAAGQPLSSNAVGPTMFCRHCHYALDGLSAGSCPKCGEDFDPQRPSTFSRTAPVQGFARVLIILLRLAWSIPLVLALGAVVGPFVGQPRLLFLLFPALMLGIFLGMCGNLRVKIHRRGKKRTIDGAITPRRWL